MYLKYIFITFAIILAFMITFFKLYLQKQKRTDGITNYLYILIWVLALYIICGIVLSIFVQDGVNKAVIVLFALSPFVIGKFATYEKENFYSILQVVCAIISAGYVYLI